VYAVNINTYIFPTAAHLSVYYLQMAKKNRFRVLRRTSSKYNPSKVYIMSLTEHTRIHIYIGRYINITYSHVGIHIIRVRVKNDETAKNRFRIGSDCAL